MIQLKDKMTDQDLIDFSNYLEDMSGEIGFKVSSRGWAYLLETRRIINKDQFDRITNLINTCRKKGYLPIDFVAEEDARAFKGVEKPDQSVVRRFGTYLKWLQDTTDYYTPDWWEGEQYYIQMVVEKVDLVTLFRPVCKKYHIPIANSKGWGSMLQRAEYARRFKEAEDNGLECVLLYCGDHDPDGLRISEFIRNNMRDLKDVSWEDGEIGYDPEYLIIERFGLNYDFIVRNSLTWIDNLITGSGRNLASPEHKNYHMPYVQHYLREIGEKKCEANAIVTMPEEARELVSNAIIEYLGVSALDRFKGKRRKAWWELKKFLKDTGTGKHIEETLKIIEKDY